MPPPKGPRINAAIITGIWAVVATIGPIGIEPNGVKAMIISKAIKIAS